MINFEPTPLAGGFIVHPQPRRDQRGWFMRTYCKAAFEEIGHRKEWVQMNHSFTVQKGTIRGLHFQRAPFEEIKLVRCIAGSVFDVMVDLRTDSPTYRQWFGTELSAENQRMLYIPEGFAHGFQTLSGNVELLYLHSAAYQPEFESGIRYNDPAIGISWPLPLTDISERDLHHPLLQIGG